MVRCEDIEGRGKEGEKREEGGKRSLGMEVKDAEKISGIREDRCKQIIVSFVRMCHRWCERREGREVGGKGEGESLRERE